MDNDTKISGNLKAYHDFIFDTNNHYSTTPNGYRNELNLSGYSAKMIMNRAEAMSCSGCHQNSRDAKIAPNVNYNVARARASCTLFRCQ
jgi:hypothetical protein